MSEYTWRDVLTPEEETRVCELEARLYNARDDIRRASPERRAIYLRAKKRYERQHKVVDKADVKA